MSAKVNWTGEVLYAALEAAAIDALDEIDNRIVTESQKELYPGHGKRTGRLQRSIQADRATVSDGKVRGRVGSRGVPYASRIHRRYEYVKIGVSRVAPLAPGILKKHVRKTGR